MMEHVDVIYGVLHIPEDIQSIIATPQFQRLKKIKQLGLLYLQFPGATYTRYDHSIGTYHRAVMMLDGLEKHTPWIHRIPNMLRKAVEIAALLHDIGHGPFSHAWEHMGWRVSHEENAFPCIDKIFESCIPEFHENNGNFIELMKSLIIGDMKMLSFPFPSQFKFLFEIVNNKKNGLDVDKWDYLKRDHYYLRHIIDPDMDFDDVFLQARASKDGSHIEYRYEDYEKIYKLFDARTKFHIHCYRIPQNLAYEQILLDTIKNNIVQINGRKLIDITSSDNQKYLELTDDKILEIYENSHPLVDVLKGACKLVAINPSTDTVKYSNLPHFTVIDEVKLAGEEMLDNAQFSFFGNVEKMPSVELKRGFYEIVSYFILKPS